MPGEELLVDRHVLEAEDPEAGSGSDSDASEESFPELEQDGSATGRTITD